MYSTQPAQLVREAQQDVFGTNGNMAPLTLELKPEDLEAAMDWLGQHAPAMRDFMTELRKPADGTVPDMPIDWIDTSWTK